MSEAAKVSFEGKEDMVGLLRSLGNRAALLRFDEDKTCVCVFVTELYAKMLQCTVEEAKKRMDENGVLAFVHSEDQLFIKRMLRRHMSEDGDSQLKVRMITAEDKEICCRANVAFFDRFDERYAYVTFSDITLQQTYEQRLKSLYRRLGEQFYQLDPDVLTKLRANLSEDHIDDIQGRDLYRSDSDAALYTELLSERSKYLPVTSDCTEFLRVFGPRSLIADYLNGKLQVSRFFLSRRWDGRLCYTQYVATLTRHPESGDIIAFITEKLSNNEKVTEVLLNRILARQFDMVSFIADGRYGVVLGEPELIKKGSIFPVSRTGDYIKYLSNQVAPVLHGSEERKEEMIRSLEPETIEEELKKQEPYVAMVTVDVDGETFYKQFDFYTVDSESKFFILLKSDITEITVRQKKRNEQLKNALQEAEAASVAKTAFLSRMSHEIRTPMNAIIGLDNIALKDKDLTETMHGYLDKIGSSARYLLSLINDILDMSRIESGRITLRMEEFSFRSLLEQVNNMIEGQCRDRGLSYECVVHGHISEHYIGDEMKLKQVLINILGNSVKFTRKGGRVSLDVRCVNEFEDQTTLEFVMKDTGIGMDPEYVPRIFEAFSQEDETNSTSYGGSGLGLAITKNIVEMMNGDITVKTEKGVGSEFTARVTLKNSDQKELEAAIYELSPRDMSVLIIDDDEMALENASIVLGEVGVSTDICTSGDEGLEMIRLKHARNENYDLVLVDLKMPEKDGIEVTKEIREMLGSELPIVILTAYSWLEIEDEGYEAGVDSFMSKPLFASSVLDEFMMALRKKKRREETTVKKADLNGRRILMAEDMFINAEIMKQLLEMRGMTVEHAENGRLAVEMFNCNPAGYYDAVLMDVRMPEMDGLMATRGIRASKHPDAKDIPIIAMTANAFDEDVQRSLQAGMNAHLSKPVEPEHLYETLETMIGGREG